MKGEGNMKGLFKKATKEMHLHTIVLIILIVTSILAYSFYSDIDGLSTNMANNDKYSKQLEFTTIQDDLSSEIDKAKIQTGLVSEIITNDVLNTYKNNDSQLLKDFVSDSPTAKLYTIINDDIIDRYLNKDTINNKMFIVCNGKVLTTSFTPASGFTRGETMNKFLGLSSSDINVNKILDRTDTYAIVGSSKTSEVDTQQLEDIYDKSGIDGFKNMYILVPTYITSDGDILGIKDLDPTGVPQKNDKMIVIQKLSIYDALINQYSLISSFKTTRNLMEDNYNHEISTEYFRNYVALALTIIMALLSVTNWQDDDKPKR
jgi:hypothetical protein